MNRLGSPLCTVFWEPVRISVVGTRLDLDCVNTLGSPLPLLPSFTLFTKMSQLVVNPNFSPMTMKSMYYMQSELRRTMPKNGPMTIYNLNLPTSANHKKNKTLHHHLT